MPSLLLRASICSALLVASALACSKKEKEGSLGGDCYPNWTCDAGLWCDRGMCVPDGSSTDGGDGDGSSGELSEELRAALDACFECGEGQCAAEADACAGEAGCDEALSCSLRCAGDASCASKCDVSGLTQTGVTAMSNYSVCTGQKCAETCVSAFADLGTETSGDGDGDDPDALEAAWEACFSCGEAECSTEAEACAEQAGCEEAVSCAFDCIGDAACIGACDISTLSVAGIEAVGNFNECTTTQCSDLCVDAIADIVGGDTSTDTGDGDGDTTEPCVSGEERYSCVDSAPQVCVGGSWVEESCEGCALVTPSNSCAKISAIAFRKVSDEEVESFPPASVSLTQTSTSVIGSWSFDYSGYEQYGVIQFKFAAAFDPAYVTINAENEGIISFETDDGSSGCEYVLSGVTPIQNVDTYWDGCWGTTSGSRTVINVRTPVTYEGPMTVSVLGILLE